MTSAADINFYDELGVASNASPEQVREAYRSLVRLLHPDQQTDEQLKVAAELQMRRINRIYAVLSDSERRRRYDVSLQDAVRPATIVIAPARTPPARSGRNARTAWAGAAVLVIGVLAWLAWDPSAPGTAQILERASASSRGAVQAPSLSAEQVDDVTVLRSDLQVARAERDAALRELARLRLSYPRPVAAPPESLPAQEETAPGASPPSDAEAPIAAIHASLQPVQPAVVKPAVRQFAGFWFYTRPPQGQRNVNRALYPPEFIEASITEQNGTLHGRYRSRYRIVDRAISPDVSFEFTGMANGGTLKCPFSGPGGVRGELTMQLTGDNAMSVEWSASELGSVQGLASGTAKLMRRVD